MALMMVSVQVPQKTVHHIFVRKPSHKLHGEKSGQNNESRNDEIHKHATNFS
jgi:hypothetical protein